MPHSDEAVAGTNVDSDGMVAFGEAGWVYWCLRMEGRQVGLIHVEPFCSVVSFDVVGY